MSVRARIRKFCLLLSYCGKNYCGMQRNPGSNTVEECLLDALKNSGLITEECFTRPQLMQFQRAARTDKSVSAIKQIVSLRIYDSITSKMKEVNQFLPNDIRLMGCMRVINSFDAKNFCDARTYSYLLPSFALCPISEITEENYRVSQEVLDSFNEILRGYHGSHVFHNFTSGKKFNEDSSIRYIKEMYCSEPFFPCNQEELEFVVIRVRGQSFMMHQIRKMIGLALAVVKGFASEEHVCRSMQEPYMDIPKAPGLGLMLEQVHFERYNKKYGGDGQHDPIEWSSQNEAIEKFKDEQIYPVVVETEIKEKSMLKWLHTLNLHSYGDNIPFAHELRKRAYDNQKGEEQIDETNESHSRKKKAKLDDDKKPELENLAKPKDTKCPHEQDKKQEVTATT